MCYNHSLINKTNQLHEQCLRTVYSDKKPKFEELPERDCSISIFHQNITFLGIEMYKLLQGIAKSSNC